MRHIIHIGYAMNAIRSSESLPNQQIVNVTQLSIPPALVPFKILYSLIHALQSVLGTHTRPIIAVQQVPASGP